MHQVSLRRLLVSAAVLGALLTTADPTRAGGRDDPKLLQVAGLDIAVWPPAAGPGPYPLVLFSHGIGGCKTQSTYLMAALARHGMLVVAPDHTDKGDNCPIEPPSPAEVEKLFLGPHEDRQDDVRKLLAALPADPGLSAWPIDPARVVLIGHSLGGHTVLGLAAASPAQKLNGIAAVVALAPYSQPFLFGGAAGSISVPVLLESGNKDRVTPAKNQDDLFAKLTGPACKVVYAGAGHFAWTDLEPEFHDATAAATIAFLDEVFARRRPTKAILASPQTDGAEDCN